MSKRLNRRKIFAVLIAIPLAVVLAFWLWYSAALAATKVGDKTVTVPPGATTDKIAGLLHEAGLIKSERAFTWHARLHRLGSKWQAGRFDLNGDKDAAALATRLTQSPNAVRITITEGETMVSIADKLNALHAVNAEEFKNLSVGDFDYDFLKSAPLLASPEGFLFPDTYDLPSPTASPKEVADIFLAEFEKKVDEGVLEQVKRNNHSLYDTLIVASIVEKEVRSDQDRRLVAGILWKRLEKGIPLGADATIHYGLGKPFTEALTDADLQSDNPYNTRIHKGLPPTPIGNPGLASILAAANPVESEFLFYINDPKTGKTIFAKTNDEQEANIDKYLR